MTQRDGSAGGLNSTGNRVLLAVASGLAVFVLAGIAGLHGVARAAVFVVAAALAYLLVTLLRRR